VVDLGFAVPKTVRAVRHDDRRNTQPIDGRGSPQPFSTQKKTFSAAVAALTSISISMIPEVHFRFRAEDPIVSRALTSPAAG
jgi:hypothetical protein